MISGMGGASFAEQLIVAERMGKDQIFESNMTKYEAQLDAYKILERSLDKMTSNLEKINGDAFEGKTSSISDDNASIMVESGAPTGNYDLYIEQLAQAHQLTKSFGSEDSLLPTSGVIEIQLGSDPADSISLDMSVLNPSGTATVKELTGMINEHSDNPGVQASLVRTGGQVELMLSSTATGAENNISVSMNGADWGMTERRAAQDAKVNLNGIDITSSSNNLANVIDGVSIELNKVHAVGESSSIKIASDTDASEQAVEDFVDIFNNLMDEINKLTRSMGSEELDDINNENDDKDDSDEDKDDKDDDFNSSITEDQLGVLKGDSSIRMLQQNMRDAIFDTAPNGMRLSDIGVEMGRDGKLDIDQDKLTKALKDDPDAIQAMFTDSGSYIDRLDTLIDPFTKFQGSMDLKQENLEKQIERVETSMDNHDRQMEQRYQIYLAQFTAMEATISQLNSASALFY
ncbi:flagellar filament capping protein FliD [Shewanella schlegeliana]|uniref:Flagellar hook-associated protein 2 n=1 Tax=Shewanella schlegeliana TaxID=190308 RepID=A0ABS1T331_9GAMM|nr:flagellar filament capping protein FliD [Shewanella schlegeliana]MBL4915210.1 flagellar filament capping protein FliD [Shewanella schlegeliana]MCL1111280.1 flagellar filament capping protein FliD [Shewanella schlegeliana]GIU37825.1 lateral flagellar hook-associated protein 2 [Shewanella schlegeliana]